ncbi:thiamine pyrophosphate-dependent enzyme [Corynebacterium macclintockiae]|uniref:thiamine pyrophosphate-dependent enzyme n=1 Tax=Corynebacterium macclintockiae TaxID=2913501 RepID=UPI003EB6E97D
MHPRNFHATLDTNARELLTNPDFALMAQSYGLHGETVRSTDEIVDTVERALMSPTGALLHVITDPTLRAPSPEVPAGVMNGDRP